MMQTTYDSINKIWKGRKSTPLYNPDQNLGCLMLQVLKQTPNEITQISDDTNVSITCKDMCNRSLKIIKYLKRYGAMEGDVIGFVTANTENLAPVVIACFTLGLPINPLSPVMIESDITQMYSITKPKIIFCDGGNLKTVESASKLMESDVKILTVMEEVDGYECVSKILKNLEDENIDDFEFPIIDSNSTAAILCSSGSTGFPKGICKSHKQIITDFFQVWGSPKHGSHVVFQGSPIFWLSGFGTLIFGTIYKFKRVITSISYDAQLLQDIILKHKVTAFAIPPFMLVSLLKLEILHKLESVESLLIGGAVVNDYTCQKFKPYIPNGKIITSYGSTEQDFLSQNFTDRNYDSSGFVYNNVEIKIINENGESLGPNEKGEICSKIPVQFTSYFNNPQKTAESFDGDWFKTGDIGYFDDEGYIYVVDRKKEMLKYKNFQVTPSEIEAIINEIKGIASSCVVGVPEQHTGNDIIHAFVILDESAVVTEKFIADYVETRVIDAKKIRGGVHIVGSFPLGLTGKVDRRKLLEMAKQCI